MCVSGTVGVEMSRCENMFMNKHVPVCLCMCGCEKAHALGKRTWVHMTVEEKPKVEVPVKCKEIDLCDCAWS